MKLIDKDALVAEIERRLHFDNNWIEGNRRWQMHTNGVSSAYYQMIGSKHDCESILDFINTLEVKEVDLEEEIKEVQRDYKTIDEYEGYPCTMYANGIEWIARHFFELGMAVGNKAQKGE